MSTIAAILLYETRVADALNFLTITSLLIAHTLNPALKFDGYWLLNDMLGKTNLHKDIKNMFLGLSRTPGFQRPSGRQRLLMVSYLACALLQITCMCWSANKGIQNATAALLTADAFGQLIGSAILLLAYAAIILMMTYKILSTLLTTFAERSHAFIRTPRP